MGEAIQKEERWNEGCEAPKSKFQSESTFDNMSNKAGCGQAVAEVTVCISTAKAK